MAARATDRAVDAEVWVVKESLSEGDGLFGPSESISALVGWGSCVGGSRNKDFFYRSVALPKEKG